MHHIHPRTTPTNTSDRSVCRFGDMCKSARCPWCHPTASVTTQQPQGDAGSDMLPHRRRTLAAVSVPAEKERARHWEERKKQSKWAQSRPTHGSETSPNRTHNNTLGNHEVRALQQPPHAAHAERAINKPPPPTSTRCPRTPQGRELFLLSMRLCPQAVRSLPRCVSVCVRPRCPVPPCAVPAVHLMSFSPSRLVCP